MKKLLAGAAALLFAVSSSLVLPTAASAGVGNGNVPVGQACQVLADQFAVSVGNCVQLLNGSTSDAGVTNANALCHYWEGPYGESTFGIPYPFASFGACTSYFNAYFHSL